MRRFAISAFGAVLCLAFSTLFTQEVLSAEKAQRLCLVNSPAELIACSRALCTENIFWILLLNIATQTSR